MLKLFYLLIFKQHSLLFGFTYRKLRASFLFYSSLNCIFAQKPIPARMPRLLSTALALLLSAAATAAESRLPLPRELASFDDKSIESSDLWNFSHQSAIDERGNCFARIVGDEMFEQLDDCCRAYWLRADSMYFRGYNVGRNERMLVDSLLPAAIFPIGKDIRLCGEYTAHGDINADIATIECGTHSAEAVACGTAIVDADTIPGVFLLKETFNYAKRFADDPAQETTEQSTVIYRWFLPGMRLPFAVQRQEDNAGSRLFVVSAYDISDIMKRADKATESIPTEDELIKILQSATVSQQGHDININIQSCAGYAIDVDVYLLDVAGNAYSHAGGQVPSNTGINLSVPSHLCGQYIVAVCVRDNPGLNHKIFVYL